MSKEIYDHNEESYQMAGRQTEDDFKDLDEFSDDMEDEDYDYDDEEEDEEVDFDNPSFSRDQIWNDYAEDLDFDD